jgi:hypothetical protein
MNTNSVYPTRSNTNREVPANREPMRVSAKRGFFHWIRLKLLAVNSDNGLNTDCAPQTTHRETEHGGQLNAGGQDHGRYRSPCVLHAPRNLP